jgi:hypothetical protein
MYMHWWLLQYLYVPSATLVCISLAMALLSISGMLFLCRLPTLCGSHDWHSHKKQLPQLSISSVS